jgi:hypothetical protein
MNVPGKDAKCIVVKHCNTDIKNYTNDSFGEKRFVFAGVIIAAMFACIL